MHNHARLFLPILLCLLILSACGASFDEQVEKASLAVEEALQLDANEANRENDTIKYYLPFWYEIIEEADFNILMKNGSKQYILFYNPQEGPNSDIVLNATTQVKDYDFVKTFQHNGKLGYLLVKKLDKNLSEVTVGVGGVKLTGEMKLSSLKGEAEMMMKIAHSVILK